MGIGPRLVLGFLHDQILVWEMSHWQRIGSEMEGTRLETRIPVRGSERRALGQGKA